MRSHLKIALLGLVSWLVVTAPAMARLCPATVPNFELVYTPLQTGGVSSSSLFSPEEIEQGERFREVLAQQGYESATALIGTAVPPDIAAYVLVWLTDDQDLPDTALGDVMALLETVPASERRDLILYYLTIKATGQNNQWAVATQAVNAIQDPRIRLGVHRGLFNDAVEQNREPDQRQQWQQAVDFVNVQPTHRAVLWAELAAAAQALGDETLAVNLSEVALEELAQANERSHSSRIFAGPAYSQTVLDKMARSLAQAQQFEVAHDLANRLDGDTTGVRLAISTAQVAAGDIEAGMSQALTLENRSFHSENLALVHTLASVGEIDCSIAAFFAPEVDSSVLYPLDAATEHTFLLWAQSERQDALLVLGKGLSPTHAGFSIYYDLMRAWAQAGEWETAVALANSHPEPEARYRLLRSLARALTVAEDFETAAQVRTIAASVANSAGFEPDNTIYLGQQGRSSFSFYSNPVVEQTFAAVRQLLREVPERSASDPTATLAELTATKDRLLEMSGSSDFGDEGILLLGEIALAMYESDAPEQAQQTLQQVLSHIPPDTLRSSLSGPTLGNYLSNPDIQALLAQYQDAGWYDGIAVWLVNPVLGYQADLNFIALDLPLSKQGAAMLDLAQTAVNNGDRQVALDLLPNISRADERARVGAIIATEIMLRSSESALRADPNAAFVQLDWLSADIAPLAVALPNSLLKVQAYLAIAQGYIALDSRDKAADWLADAVTLMGILEGDSGQ